MGAKASTPATNAPATSPSSGQQSPRSRTFSSSSTGVGGLSSPPDGISHGGFNLLRNLPGLQVQNATNTSSSVDRQRARSLSSVPDPSGGGAGTGPSGSTTPSQQFGHNLNNNNNNNHMNRDNDGVRFSGLTIGGGGSFHGHPLLMNGSGHSGGPGVHHGGAISRSGMAATHHTLGGPLSFHDLEDATSLAGSSAAAASFMDSIAQAAGAGPGGGRVYTATSLPSHIWSFNGIKCPVCNKFVLPDDIECHLVMCLTKPRLSYNEDVLSDAKGECVICLEDLNPGDVIARLPCLCIYHKGCIDRWFEVNRSCPEHPGD